MNDVPFEALKKAAESVQDSSTFEKKVECLSRAFELFSHETQRLEEAYKSLKQQFESVNFELEESNRQLMLKIAELDVVTYYLDSILSNISQGLVFIDLIGNITTYNTAAQRILEVDRLDVLFEPFWHGFQDDHFGFSMRKALKAKRVPATTFTRIVLSSGHLREIEVDATIVLQKKPASHAQRLSPTLDVMKGLIILIRDVTDLRRLQIIANRNDRMKELGEMAAIIAHEIRNPLGGIKGFASLLARDLIDKPAQKTMAEYIVEGTNTLNNLVNHVLDYARPLDVHLENVDILPLIQNLQIHLKADPAWTLQHFVALETHLSTAYIPIDVVQIKGALLNLLINALQAMPKGGKITVKIYLEQRSLVIIISDTGEGIPPNSLDKIFSPFFTTKIQGNGLGLCEVHKIIQAHGGTIDVHSVLGQGSTFAIHLPSLHA